MPFLPKSWRIAGKWHGKLKWFWKKKEKNPHWKGWKNGHEKLFFLQKHRETEIKSRFLANDLLQNWKKPRIMLKKVWYFSRAKNKVICIEKWSEFSFWISRSPSKFQKLVRNSDSIKRISKLSSQIKVIKASSAQARLLVITSG